MPMHNQFRTIFLAALLTLAYSAGPSSAQSDHWVASWATSPAAYFVYTPPVVPANPPGYPQAYAPATIQPDQGFPFPTANQNAASNQTFRSIVKPDLWGRQ